MQAAVDNGLFNPLLGVGEQSAQGLAALQAAAMSGEWTRGRSRLWKTQAQVSHDVKALPGGPWQLSLGASWLLEQLSNSPSLLAQGMLIDPDLGLPIRRAGDATERVPWTHALTVNYQSVYQDKPMDVDVLDASGAAVDTIAGYQRRAKPWVTVDWQTRWQINARWRVALGLNNVLGRAPPFTIAASGGSRGQIWL